MGVSVLIGVDVVRREASVRLWWAAWALLTVPLAAAPWVSLLVNGLQPFYVQVALKGASACLFGIAGVNGAGALGMAFARGLRPGDDTSGWSRGVGVVALSGLSTSALGALVTVQGAWLDGGRATLLGLVPLGLCVTAFGLGLGRGGERIAVARPVAAGWLLTAAFACLSGTACLGVGVRGGLFGLPTTASGAALLLVFVATRALERHPHPAGILLALVASVPLAVWLVV